MLEIPVLLNIDFQVFERIQQLSNRILRQLTKVFVTRRILIKKCAIEQSLRGSVPKDLNQIFSIPCGYRDRTNRNLFLVY